MKEQRHGGKRGAYREEDFISAEMPLVRERPVIL